MGRERRMDKIARVLIVAGSDSSGGAGVQADLKAVSALGGYGMTAITALTAQNTTGVFGVHLVPPDFVRQQIDVCVQDIGVDAVKTGMLANAAIIDAVAAAIEAHKLPNLVVDPVMVAKSGARLLDEDAVETLRTRLIPLATVITPNIPEAEALLGRDIKSLQHMYEAAHDLTELGCRAVVVKGGHREGDAVDVVFDGKKYHEFRWPRVETRNTHGTGCCFASAIATGLAQGYTVADAVGRAKRFITAAIEHALDLGKGHGPCNPMAWCLAREATDMTPTDV